MTDSSPLLSIVTPSYNQAAYLETTLQSVLQQSYPRVEYIVIDGGSDDGSLEIIARYADQLAYWESEPDRGQADAINKGLKRASGKYVAWINSDDVYMPGAFSSAVRNLEDNPQVGMVYADGLMVDERLRLLDPHRYPQISLPDLLAFEVLLQPAVFMRRTALEAVGFLNDTFDLILDHELWVRIASRFPILHVPEYWALERTHGEAKTITQAAGFVEEAEAMLNWAAQSEQSKERFDDHSNFIMAGFHVFAARRLIDADAFPRAVGHLSQAFRLHPGTVLRYWYKVVQAGFSALGLAPLFLGYRRMRRRLQFGEVVVNPELPLAQQPELLKRIS